MLIKIAKVIGGTVRITGKRADVIWVVNKKEEIEEIIKKIRQDADFILEKLGDAGTNNFLCELLEKHEKMAWMLRAFLQ